MRARPFSALACFALLAGGSLPRRVAADCDDPFARPGEVLDFHLQIRRADWHALLASKVTSPDAQPTDGPACLESFPKFAAQFRCGEREAFRPLTVRRKRGEERGVEAVDKPPLKLDFGDDLMGTQPAARGQRWPGALGVLGFRRLTLNNGQSNKYADRVAVLPVLQSEHVALRLLAADVPLTPKTAYATLTVHFEDASTYRGVYVLVEDIDRAALRRRQLTPDGRLEKASTYNCSPELEFDDGPPNQATAAFEALMAKDAAAHVGRWSAEVERGLDLDVVLRQEAAREILVSGNDTLFNSRNPPGWGNNWVAFDPRQGVRQYLPWDLDLAFGQQGGSCQPTPLQCPATVPLMTWCTGPAAGPASPYAQTSSRLGLQLACHPEIAPRYLRAMCELTQGALSESAILTAWNEAYATLEPLVPRERDGVWRGVDPLASPADPQVIETLGSEHRRIQAWVPARIAHVRAELARLGLDCPERCASGATSPCSHLGRPAVRTCIEGRWTICAPAAP